MTLHRSDTVEHEGTVDVLFPVGVIVILVVLGALAHVVGAERQDDDDDDRPRHTLRGVI